jgi:hypothetical protein
MANDISQRQNEDQALRLLASETSLYGWAKVALSVQLILVILVPGILLVIEHLATLFKVWAAFIGLAISVIDLILLDPVKTALQQKAADIQELFDCQTLSLDWPRLKGNKPDREDLHETSTLNKSTLKDWYPKEVVSLPLYVARVVCQRSNCWWDSKLRRFYRITVLSATVVLIVAVVVYALLKNLTFGDFILSLMAPILPGVLWGIREGKLQSEAAERADRLKKFGDDLWERIIEPGITAEVAGVQSRMFQDGIYEHRRKSPMIFNWFYELFKIRFESQMRYSATEMVKEAQEKDL